MPVSVTTVDPTHGLHHGAYSSHSIRKQQTPILTGILGYFSLLYSVFLKVSEYQQTFIPFGSRSAIMSTIRLGTASPGSKSTSAETIKHISHIASRAAEAKIDILLLPEAYIGGYPRGTSFGCVIGNRSDEGREEFARYFEQAIDLGDTVGNGAGAGSKWVNREIGLEGQERGDGSREKLERIASESGVFIVVGCIEKAGGSLYCSVVYIDPSRGMIGKRRKVMPVSTSILSPDDCCTLQGLISRSSFRPAPSVWSGLKAVQALCVQCRPLSAASALTSPRRYAGRTTCPSFASHCTHRTSTSISLRRQITATLGFPS